MWTDTTRAHHARAGLALPSDLTDAEWAVLEPFFPPPSHVGRPRKWPMRRIVEAILYLLRGGLPWRMLPALAIARLAIRIRRDEGGCTLRPPWSRRRAGRLRPAPLPPQDRCSCCRERVRNRPL